jgi:alpha-L-fucosidase
MLVNNRVDVHRGGMAGFSQGDEAVGRLRHARTGDPRDRLAGVDWETCMTMNDHWGFNAADANWKSDDDAGPQLIDIASKGGNYLLNVGPTRGRHVPAGGGRAAGGDRRVDEAAARSKRPRRA